MPILVQVIQGRRQVAAQVMHPYRTGVLGGTLDIATETDNALAVGSRKTKAIGIAAETDSALAVTRQKTRVIGIATETDSALAVSHRKTRTLGIAAETDASLAITSRKTKAIGIATETDAALAMGGVKSQVIGTAAETDSAIAIGTGAIVYTSAHTTQTPTNGDNSDGQPINTGTKYMFSVAGIVAGIKFWVPTSSNSGTFTVGLWESTGGDGVVDDTGTGTLLQSKTIPYTDVTPSGWGEVFFDTPVVVETTKVYLASVHSSLGRYVSTSGVFTSGGITNGNVTALQSGTAPNPPNIGSVRNSTYDYGSFAYPNNFFGEPDYFVDVLYLAGNFSTVTTATETDNALTASAPKIGAVSTASETDSALGLSVRKTKTLGIATETNTALAITHRKTVAIDIASETDAALAVARRKTQVLGIAAETDAALAMSAFQLAPRRARVLITSEARSRARQAYGFVPGISIQYLPVQIPPSQVTVGTAAETDTAGAIGAAKRRSIGTATESSTALVVTPVKRRAIGITVETDTALGVSHRKLRVISTASEIDSARTITQRGVVLAATEIDTASPLTHAKHRAIGIASTTDAALAVARRHGRLLGIATETDIARGLTKRVGLGMVVELDSAGIMTVVMGAGGAPKAPITIKMETPHLTVQQLEPSLTVQGGASVLTVQRDIPSLTVGK